MENFFYRLPAELLESGDHTKTILYSVIESLCRKNGHCWGSNEFLAKKINRGKSTVGTHLKKLIKEGWIEAKYQNGYTRSIKLLRSYNGKYISSLPENISYPTRNLEESNIKSNINKYPSISPLPSPDKTDDGVTWEEMGEKLGAKTFKDKTDPLA